MLNLKILCEVNIVKKKKNSILLYVAALIALWRAIFLACALGSSKVPFHTVLRY